MKTEHNVTQVLANISKKPIKSFLHIKFKNQLASWSRQFIDWVISIDNKNIIHNAVIFCKSHLINTNQENIDEPMSMAMILKMASLIKLLRHILIKSEKGEGLITLE